MPIAPNTTARIPTERGIPAPRLIAHLPHTTATANTAYLAVSVYRLATPPAPERTKCQCPGRRP